MNGVWKELLIFSGVESLMMAVWKYLGPSDPCGVDNTPRWSWQVSLLFQLVIFPGLCYYAWIEDGKVPLDDWLVLPWPQGEPHDETRHGIRWFLCAFTGYMIKDFWPFLMKIGPMYVVHHIVSLFICFCFLFGDMPPAIFVFGSSVAEVGSALMNMDAQRWFRGARYGRTAFVGMTLFNLGTSYLLIPLNQHPSMQEFVGMRAAITVITLALCFERERFAHGVYQAELEELAVKGVKTA
jgi:hypothetical protein